MECQNVKNVKNRLNARTSLQYGLTLQVAQQKSEQQEAAKACNLKSGFAALVML